MAPSGVCHCNIIPFTATSKFFVSSLFLLLTLALAAVDDLAGVFKCADKDLINGSARERNSNVVQSSLVKNVGKTGYSISSHGENGDSVYGLAQCRGDLNASACHACVRQATEALVEICGNYSGSIYVMDGCFLRYGTYNFYSKLLATSVDLFNCSSISTNGTNSTDPNSSFLWPVAHLLTTAVNNAVASNVGYGTDIDGGNYSLAQCWRDLSMADCRKCLNSAYNNFQICLQGSDQRVAVSENCMIRYETYKFFGDAVLLPSPPGGGRGPSLPPSPSNGRAPSLPFSPSNGSSPSIPPSGDTKGKRQLGSVMAGVVVAMVVVLVLVVAWKRKVIQRRYKKQPPGPSSEFSTAISKSKLNYKFQILKIATKNFDLSNKIGQGGFGTVYKGVLPDHTEIAVKRLSVNREQSVSDFFNEVNLISHVQHKNLVKLLGCSVDGPDRLLVYEYLLNKSLDNFLFDQNMGKLLYWQRRFEIILGIASGLAYLHQESDIRIIHRDVKASNILLDQHFKPKIADFGLVRYFAEDQTHISTTIVGTRGYMAPEYLVHGHLTEKVDIYAFGVLVLEIISGKKNSTPMHANDTPSLLTVVWNDYVYGTISNIIDPNIEENLMEEVVHVVHIALLCTQASATLRPSMSKVIMFLTSKDINIPAATQPPFIDAIHSESNNFASSNGPHSNNYGSLPNIGSPPTTIMSLNTISTSSFGPR